MAREPALELIMLTKRYGGTLAVDAVNLRLEAGRCLALLGPNGAGKTTLCEMIEGLIPPDSGTIDVLGVRQGSKNRKRIAQRIGATLQETVLYRKYTVLETLRLFASFYERSTDPQALLDVLGMGEKADARLEHLSGGQLQKVYLACSMVHDPDLLFLDEPTTGLDPLSRRELWDLIRSLKQRGKTILLTSHYMEEAQELADDVAIMDRGKIMVSAPPKELIRNQGYTHMLQAEFSDEAVAKTAAEQLRAMRHPAVGKVQPLQAALRVQTTEALEAMRLMTEIAARNDWKLAEMTVRPSNLEDVFLAVAGRGLQHGD